MGVSQSSLKGFQNKVIFLFKNWIFSHWETQSGVNAEISVVVFGIKFHKPYQTSEV